MIPPVTMEHLTLGEWLQLIQIGAIVLGGIVVLVNLRSNVRELTHRLVGVETEMKKLVDVMVTIGRQDERILAMERRLQLVENIQIVESTRSTP